MVEDESTDLFFGEKDVSEGIGPQTRDQYLRTLIRNTYNYHMNEIFATVQNEYTDWSLQVSLLESFTNQRLDVKNFLILAAVIKFAAQLPGKQSFQEPKLQMFVIFYLFVTFPNFLTIS